MNARFFASAEEFRAWLMEHHDQAPELWVGYYKKHAGREGLTYAESVDEALCFGWIDGQTRRIDDLRYMVRFTPRRRGSIWSAKNIARIAELTAAGRMHPPGSAAFAARDPAKSTVYSHEAENPALTPDQETAFRANAAAWAFFEAQPFSYRRAATWWVVSAKQETTRQRRLQRLIDASASSQRLAQFTSPARRVAQDQ